MATKLPENERYGESTYAGRENRGDIIYSGPRQVLTLPSLGGIASSPLDPIRLVLVSLITLAARFRLLREFLNVYV